MTLHAPKEIKNRIREAKRRRLFLDYDGTLADFARTPDEVNPDPEVIELVTELASSPQINVTVISGRRLAHIEKLIPIPGVLLAGTYGVELLLPNGERVERVPYERVRPVLEEIKPRWSELIAHREGFFLEDKDWALAIHARHAAEAEADEVLRSARQMAETYVERVSSELFRILDGHRFLEIGPALAHKGKTVDYLLDRYPWPGALPLYIGDDDKDEEVFSVIHDHGGVAIKVCEEPCATDADGRLESPEEVRGWLVQLNAELGE